MDSQYLHIVRKDIQTNQQHENAMNIPSLHDVIHNLLVESLGGS